MTTPYSEPVKGEWYQFDPNVHYYYDEQGQLHYYDPNTNQECDYQPQYSQQDYYLATTEKSIPQTYTPIQHHQAPVQTPQTPIYADLASSRQPTPDVLLPCPEPTCNGENKPKSKFCEECGRPLGAISRSATPASNSTTLISTLTKTFSHQQIQDYNYYPQQEEQQQQQFCQQQQQQQPQHNIPLDRPPTAPVYSSNLIESSRTVPLYHQTTTDPRHQPHSYYNGVQHQSMQDLYGASQAPEQNNNATRQMQYNTGTAYNNLQQQQQQQQQQQYEPQQPTVDPLDRARGCPIVTFGFGGKMLVTFPRAVTNYYSSTVKPQPGPIRVKYLKNVIPKPSIPFVGPVLFDSKVSVKQKKKDVAHFMSQMMDRFEKEKEMVPVDSLFYHQMEAKILLWRLVKVMVETEGTVNDKDKMDHAILQVLRPVVSEVEESNFTIPSYPINTNNTTQEDIDVSDHMLSKIEHFLLNGDRKGAVEFAIQEDLWAHALIISSCVDKELWQRVITNFVDREMNASPEMRQQRRFNNIAGNNQALRVMYSLFSGAGGIAMNEFLVNDIQHVNTPYGLQTVTPPAQLSQLVKWRDTLAILLANRTPRDLEALTALGDIMKEQGWIDVAHICYLLSPQHAMHSGIDTIQVRLTLLGSDHPTEEAYELTEIFEFASSLHNGSICLPFLQGYKLAHAWILADYGLLDEAERYHEAIDQCIKSFTKGSPYLHQQLIDKVAAFGTYLENARGKKNGVDPGSWLKPKFQKKALTSLWGTLEGSFTKFVSGDEIVAQEPTPPRKSTEIMSRPF